jgi:hypothetical protein
MIDGRAGERSGMRGAEMEVYLEMHVQADRSERIDALMGELEKVLPSGWNRDHTLEEEHGHIVSPRRLFCFTFDGDDRFPRSSILLIEDEPGRLRLSNIFSRILSELEIGQSNDLLEEFYWRILEPCAGSMGLRAELTPRDKNLSHWLTDKAAGKFRRFSAGANRRAGYLLPLDRKRWLEFILAAHQEASELDAVTLRRWLVEIEGWSPEVADQLAREYAFGEELLTFSESHRAGA